MMSRGSRPDRVADQIRAELADLLARQVHDPGIGFVTLTRVQLSPDLQWARVYYTSLGDETAHRKTARAIERATSFLRRQLGSRLRLRRVPELAFIYDESVAGQDRIERILSEIHAQGSADPERPRGPTPDGSQGPTQECSEGPNLERSRDSIQESSRGANADSRGRRRNPST